jgi:hypothetical protein
VSDAATTASNIASCSKGRGRAGFTVL